MFLYLKTTYIARFSSASSSTGLRLSKTAWTFSSVVSDLVCMSCKAQSGLVLKLSAGVMSSYGRRILKHGPLKPLKLWLTPHHLTTATCIKKTGITLTTATCIKKTGVTLTDPFTLLGNRTQSPYSEIELNHLNDSAS